MDDKESQEVSFTVPARTAAPALKVSGKVPRGYARKTAAKAWGVTFPATSVLLFFTPEFPPPAGISKMAGLPAPPGSVNRGRMSKCACRRDPETPELMPVRPSLTATGSRIHRQASRRPPKNCGAHSGTKYALRHAPVDKMGYPKWGGSAKLPPPSNVGRVRSSIASKPVSIAANLLCHRVSDCDAMAHGLFDELRKLCLKIRPKQAREVDRRARTRDSPNESPEQPCRPAVPSHPKNARLVQNSFSSQQATYNPNRSLTS
jgi:hypothetical protein